MKKLTLVLALALGAGALAATPAAAGAETKCVQLPSINVKPICLSS